MGCGILGPEANSYFFLLEVGGGLGLRKMVTSFHFPSNVELSKDLFVLKTDLQIFISDFFFEYSSLPISPTYSNLLTVTTEELFIKRVLGGQGPPKKFLALNSHSK